MRGEWNNVEKKIKQALVLEENAQKLLAELKEDIGKAIHSVGPLAGVMIISEMPNCATISFSALQRTNLAPTTYLPCEQAAAVMRCLASKSTVKSVLKEMDELVEGRLACVSGGEKVTLNENTIQALTPYAHFSGERGT